MSQHTEQRDEPLTSVSPFSFSRLFRARLVILKLTLPPGYWGRVSRNKFVCTSKSHETCWKFYSGL